MKIEYDPDKSEKNIREREVSFELIRSFEWESALIRLDLRKDYGEPRFNALGMIGYRVFHVTFTLRNDTIRVISLRKANKREVYRYADYQDEIRQDH